MPRARLHDGDMTLRAVSPRDIELIRQWRNDQMDILRQVEVITPEAQENYFASQIWPEMRKSQPRQILLAIEVDEELIGYGGLVHISWDYKRAEISFLLKPELECNAVALQKYFYRYLVLIQRLSFEDLRLHRLTTETYAQRKIHISVLEAAGLMPEGILRQHVVVGGQRMDALMHGILANEWLNRCEDKSKSILITSASHKAPLVRALKNAAQRVAHDMQVIAGDLDSLAPSQIEADGFWQMPRIHDDSLSELIEGCHFRGIVSVIPTRDGELEFWSRHRKVFSNAGIEVIVSSNESIKRCLDKLAFSTFGYDAGLPIIPASDSPESFPQGKLVVKERFGAGSRGIGLNLTKQEAVEHARYLDMPIFQPFLAGPEISIDGWVDQHGKVVGVVLRRRDRVVAGESQVTTTFRDLKIEAQATTILNSLELRGPVVLQAIITKEGIQIIECNPRFGGASTASISVGLDSLYWSLAEVLGLCTQQSFSRENIEIQQIRLPVDRIFHDTNL